MSTDDIDSIGTMMLGELRDVHNLEKEMLETKEAVVVQERRFEQEVENLCALDKRKVRLENHFNDLLESVFIEYDRVSQCIAEYMSKLSSLSIGDRVENYFTSRKFCGTKSLEFINCHRALQTKITAINDKSRSDIKGEISFIENGLRLKRIALQEQRNGLLNLSMREETNASASKMLQLEHTHKNLEIETAQLEFYRIGDALEIGLANEAEVDIEVVKMKLSNESEMHCLNSCLTNIILKLNEIADRNITLVTEVQEKVLHNEALADQSILLRRQHQEMFDRLESTISITREAKDAISETESDICLKRRDIFLIQSQTEALKLRAANFIFADSSNLDVLKLDAQANRLKSATEILNRNFKLVNSELSDVGIADSFNNTLDDINRSIFCVQQRIINIEDGKKKIKLHCDSNLYPLNDASASKIESLETKRFALEANAEGLECCLKKSQDKISLLNKEKSFWHSRLVFRQNLTSRLKTEVSKFEKGAIDIEDLKQKMMETEIQREIIRQRNCDSWTAAQISECIGDYEKEVSEMQNQKISRLTVDLDCADKLFKTEFKRLKRDFTEKKDFLKRRIDYFAGDVAPSVLLA